MLFSLGEHFCGSVITHYDTFIHTGCKVPWALRGGTGNAASEEASHGIHGLQVVPTTTNSGTDAKVFAAHRANSFTPAGREKSVYSPCLTMSNSAELSMGTGDAKR